MNSLELANHIANLLNEALALDPDGLSKLLLRKEPINEALAEHPTIQAGIIPDPHTTVRHIRESGVRVDMVDTKHYYGLSPLGLMNGLLDGNYAVAAAVEEDTNKIQEFIVITLPAEPLTPSQSE